MTLFREFRDIFSYTYEAIPWIYPSFSLHQIKTYPDSKQVCQKLRQVHPQKEPAINE